MLFFIIIIIIIIVIIITIATVSQDVSSRPPNGSAIAFMCC